MNLSLADFPLPHLPKATPKAARFAARLMGERVPDAEVYGCEGAELSDHGVVLLCTADDEPFQYLVRSGLTWRVHTTVARHDESILKHRDSFVRIADPAKEAAARRKRANAERRLADEAEARRANAELLEQRRAEWERRQLVEQTQNALRFASGEELANARSVARELGIQAPLGTASL